MKNNSPIVNTNELSDRDRINSMTREEYRKWLFSTVKKQQDTIFKQKMFILTVFSIALISLIIIIYNKLP